MLHTKNALLFLLLVSLGACVARPKGEFNTAQVPPAPDYSRLENWAAHPDKEDPADRTPLPEIKNMQSDAAVDVLFFYPTSYTGSKRSQKNWNADVSDAATNKKTDETSILFQASIFNGVGRVFSPRYRQAHLAVFFDQKKEKSNKAALDLAYSDIESAFNYYLEHWNNGRPFIIASHSQGALHAMNLIKKRIEGTQLESQLVAAYIVGWGVRNDFFTSFKPCESPDQTGCYCTWRTWNRKFVMKRKADKRLDTAIVCTNPICWTITEGQYCAKTDNKGGVVYPYEKVYANMVDAEVFKGVLLSRKPKFKGSFLFLSKNYHVGDLNLYYMNVRANASERANAYFKR